MSKRSKQSAEAELEEIGGQIVAEVTREQMQTKIAALRDKLAAAMDASAKAAAAGGPTMDAYLRRPARHPKSEG